MMDIQVYKFATDALLVIALIYLCYRMSQSSNSKTLRLPGLEQGLKGLIKEADEASRELNAKLLKRKTSLENLLFDLETVESRLNRAMNSAEETKSNLQAETARANKLRQELGKYEYSTQPVYDQQAEPVSLQESWNVSNSTATVQSEAHWQASRNKIQTSVPEPASFSGQGTMTEEDLDTDDEEPRWSNRNIYGEEINVNREPVEAAPAFNEPAQPQALQPELAEESYTPLAKAVERERHNPYTSVDNSQTNQLQRIYDAAEEMLKTGIDLETVSSRTSLPLEEVKLLSHMLAQERQSGEAVLAPNAGDSRLGVLSPMQRKTQIL